MSKGGFNVIYVVLKIETVLAELRGDSEKELKNSGQPKVD